MRHLTIVATALLLALGCAGEPASGLGATSRAGGVQVTWDPEAKPLPEIPLPNDAATQLDPSSPTGRRINVSTRAGTDFESRMRAHFDRLDGFGIYAPITVSFGGLLDLPDLWARHNGGPWPEGGPHRDDFRDDAVYLLNVDRGCGRFGEEVALDIGRGRFPVILDAHSRRIPDADAPEGYRLEDGDNITFEYDPRGLSNNVLFEERSEDTNRNGVLDPGEDTDFDDHLDQPNLMHPHACDGEEPHSLAWDRCIADNLLTFYDRENNTLILRPVWPLEQGCRYAVVLTRRLLGADGLPVESPFPAVNPASQSDGLSEAPALLSRYGLEREDIAFAWTFSTGLQTQGLEVVRKGLYGHGPLARLSTEFPVQGFEVFQSQNESADGAMEQGACLGMTISSIWRFITEEWTPNLCAIDTDLKALGGGFWGRFSAPNFMVDKDGGAAPGSDDDDDESWDLDPTTGTATVGTTEVSYWCVLPREQPSVTCEAGNPDGVPFCRPFPVLLYAHGYTGSRIGMQDFMGRHAAMGYATCAIDSYGHGGNYRLVEDVVSLYGLLFAPFGTPRIAETILGGRDRDLNNDGTPDPGGDFWTADLFHTRDMLRQSVVEWMQLVRILRSFDGKTKSADGGLLGDVDGDGKVDLGGPKNTVSLWGISLGGITTGILKGAEPSLDAASPNAGGAGLTDIGTRSRQAGVPEAVYLPVIGPLILGALERDDHQRPVAGSALRLTALVNNAGQSQRVDLGQIPEIQPGDVLVVENLEKGTWSWAKVSPRGTVRVAVGSDALGPVERRPLLAQLTGVAVKDLVYPVVVEDTTRLGDRLRLTAYRGDAGPCGGECTPEQRFGTPLATFATFGIDVTFQGTTYPAGAPLVALQEGLGYRRNSPELRRFLGIAQHALDPADPATWSARLLDPIDVSYDPHVGERWRDSNTRVLVMPTAGDMNVPVNTAISEARAAGLYGSWMRDESVGAEWGWRKLFEADPRYGHSMDYELVRTHVYESVDRLERFKTSHPDLIHPSVLYDIDDLADGRSAWSCKRGHDGDWDTFDCPGDARDQPVFFETPRASKPMRANRARGDGTFDAVRIPMLRPQGQHGLYNAQPFRRFDMDAAMVNLTTAFLGTRGRVVELPGGCDCSASAIGTWITGGAPMDIAIPNSGLPCASSDLKLCSAACTDALGLRSPEGKVECRF